MNPTLFTLGSFPFRAFGLAPRESRKTDGWIWAEVPRIGRAPALQHVGKEAETLSMAGILYNGITDVDVSLGQQVGGIVTGLAGLADSGEPRQLTDGSGRNYGRWVVLRIERTNRVFLTDGRPRAVDFIIELKRYD